MSRPALMVHRMPARVLPVVGGVSSAPRTDLCICTTQEAVLNCTLAVVLDENLTLTIDVYIEVLSNTTDIELCWTDR